MIACFLLGVFAGLAPAQEKPLKIGIIGPFTGPSAKTGAEFKGSVTLALEKINYKVGDYKLEPVFIDSQSDPAKVTSAYAEACERLGVQAGVLNWHSSTAVAAMDISAQYKVPHIFGFGATEVVNQKWLSNPEKYNYWSAKGWPVPAKLMSGYAESIDAAVQSGKYKPKAKVAAIACEDTDWGHSAGEAMAKEFEKRGWKIAAKDFFAITQTDFYPLLSKYKKEDVAVLFSTSTAAPITSAFIKQTREVGLKSLIIIDGLGWSGDWYAMSGAASDGVLDMIPQLTTKEAKAWAEAFEKRFNMKPSPSAGGLSYDGVNFFVKILKRALEKSGKLDKETIHKVIVEEVNTGKLTYSKADGAIIMNEYRYNKDTAPDPVVARDGYFFPVIQYKGGVGKIVYPADWAEADFMAP
ncbi:MAG: ABC transporter substrate-binding protein [Deltaproteobacteria bacterium]|nr:ABC transporter substrate-binding protein [Deltaproteobacteria bacterium]